MGSVFRGKLHIFYVCVCVCAWVCVYAAKGRHCFKRRRSKDVTVSKEGGGGKACRPPFPFWLPPGRLSPLISRQTLCLSPILRDIIQDRACRPLWICEIAELGITPAA